MYFANCASLAAVLFTITTYFNWKFETLFFCWGWIVRNLFLNFEQKWASCSYKIVLTEKNKCKTIYKRVEEKL